jgi:hypothetical protein
MYSPNPPHHEQNLVVIFYFFLVSAAVALRKLARFGACVASG